MTALRTNSEPPPQVVIVRTGSANLASVAAALHRLGAAPLLTEDPAIVLAAPAVILPGVGAFGAAMTHLQARGLDEAIRQRVRNDLPLLAICLGMQILCEFSDETPGVPGLGIVPARVGRFSNHERVPQIGWNRITPAPTSTTLQPDWMYFAHSYRIDAIPDGWEAATTEYAGVFVSALRRGSLLACQFHPELSGAAGHALIARWLALAAGRTAAPHEAPTC